MGNSGGSTEGTLDPALRDRIAFEFQEVMRAFEAAVDQPTPEAYAELREATDQLMRAGAAILLALSRAERGDH